MDAAAKFIGAPPTSRETASSTNSAINVKNDHEGSDDLGDDNFGGSGGRGSSDEHFGNQRPEDDGWDDRWGSGGGAGGSTNPKYGSKEGLLTLILHILGLALNCTS